MIFGIKFKLFSISMNQPWISNGENCISALVLGLFDLIWSMNYFLVDFSTKMTILEKSGGFVDQTVKNSGV